MPATEEFRQLRSARGVSSRVVSECAMDGDLTISTNRKFILLSSESRLIADSVRYECQCVGGHPLARGRSGRRPALPPTFGRFGAAIMVPALLRNTAYYDPARVVEGPAWRGLAPELPDASAP